MSTEVKCVDCSTKYNGHSWELPIRCNSCGGNLKNTEKPTQPEEVWSDKA